MPASRLGAHVRANGHVYTKAIELVVLVAGVAFGLKGIYENTASNLTASRAQLYASEAIISSREYDASGTSLQSLYAQPDDAVTDPKEYVRVRMAAISDDPRILAARNVSELYDAFNGLKTFGPQPPGAGLVDTRRAYNHLSSIFEVMHSALDYQRESVISRQELSTWFGYVTDIGPHPLLLTTLWSWHDGHDMSREFARSVRQLLLDQSPRNRRVIEYFYPQMLAPEYLQDLTDY